MSLGRPDCLHFVPTGTFAKVVGERGQRALANHCWIIDHVISREGQFHLQATVADAFRLSEEALIVIGGRIAVRDREAGRLFAATPWSLKSWGENIQVAVGGADGDVSVRVRIDSKVSMTLIDWGQSADNMKRFGDWLTKTHTT